MYPYIQITLPSYSVMAFTGGFFAVCIIYFRLEKYKIDFTSFLKLFFLSAIACLAGSKILFAITQIPWLLENFSFKNLILLIPQSGLVFYGGLFGIIFMLLYLTRKDLEFRKNVFRVSVPAMPLFHSFGRIGCFMAGCCYGKTLSNPINIGIFTFNEIPVQLIEALSEFLLFIVLFVLDKKNKEANLLKVYLISYAFIRFFDEFLRGDEIRGIFAGFSTAQWISMAIILFYVFEFIKRKKHNL